MKALLVSAATIGLLAAAPAYAAPAGAPDSADGTADAEIVTPITVTTDANNGGGALNFGRIAADSAPSTVTIDGNDGRTGSSPNVLLSTGATPSSAHFTVAGQTGLTYDVTPDASVTLTSGTDTMTSTLVAYPGDGYQIVAGADSFTVGGTLSVGANQAAGNYHGTFHVLVQYN